MAMRYRWMHYSSSHCEEDHDPHVEPEPTITPVLSCTSCNPCTITSKPYIEVEANGSGVPHKVKPMCNTFSSPASAVTTSALLYIYAPVKHYDYRETKIVFWAGINEHGQIVSLSDPNYTDYIYASGAGGRDLTMSMPVHERQTPPTTPVNAFSAYNVYARTVTRTFEDHLKLRTEMAVPSSNFDDEMTTWWTKDRLGTIEFNPVTREFRNVKLTQHKFRTLSRTLTAANYTDGSSYSMLYLPSNGVHIFKPLQLADGTQFIGWKQQGAGFTNNGVFCFDTEWHSPNPNMMGYGGLSAATVSLARPNLNPEPQPVPTSNFHTVTGFYTGIRYSAFSLSMTKYNVTRPRTRFHVATTSTGLDHHDHHQRRFNIYNFPQTIIPPISGYVFPKTTACPVSGKQFYITDTKYPNTCAPAATADRMFAEMRGQGWDIADFTHFTALSALEFAMFLNQMGHFNENTPIEAPPEQKFLQLIGFCTYKGSLTSADGKYYCLATARGQLPTWCTPVTGIGNFYGSDLDNFAVCVSGCNLSLPYITYKHV